MPSAKSDGSPFIRYSQTRSACCQWREPFAFPAADDFDCPISAASPRQDRPCCAAKMKNKNTWSIPDIAALADYFGVPVTSLLDDTLMRQMLGEGNLGASLVAATTARFPVRAAEGQADGLKPLETKGSGPRYLVETGAGGYPQRGGYERQLPQEQTANPSNVYLLIINLNFRYSNDSRLLPVDTRAVLLLSVIFMRLMAETTCDE